MEIRLSELIIPKFFEMADRVLSGKNDIYQFWLKGGRASLKSSVISILIPLILMNNPNTHFVILRKVADTLRSSVYNQMLWAFDKLGLTPYIKETVSPMEIVYGGNGMEQVIYFRGCDNPAKLKSIKPRNGRIIGIWFEELEEYAGMDELRNVRQSVMRGEEADILKAGTFFEFASFNPPKRMTSWVNGEANTHKDGRMVIHSTYLDIPYDKRLKWLGEKWLYEAEHLQKVNEMAYRHEYLGEITGTGGAVFPNAKQMSMSDDLINSFDNLRQGLDFGYIHPAAWVRLHYDYERRSIYIFDEIYATGMQNESLYKKIMEKSESQALQDIRTIADRAEPKSIEQLKRLGLFIKPCDKGADSRGFGINWLQALENIYIDPIRCPNTWREFSMYELEKDKNGNFKDNFPDLNEDSIFAVSYAMNDDKLPKEDYLTQEYN